MPIMRHLFQQYLSQLKLEYIDTDKIKFGYKHFPLDFHQNAKVASVASEWAKEQGKFWEYHNLLMTDQTTWENLSGKNVTETFKNYA